MKRKLKLSYYLIISKVVYHYEFKTSRIFQLTEIRILIMIKYY